MITTQSPTIFRKHFALLLFISYLFSFQRSQSQNVEITQKAKLFGLYNTKTKVWLVPPIYKGLYPALQEYYKKFDTTAYIASLGKTKLLLDKKGKPIPGAVFENIFYTGQKKLLEVKVKGKYALYEMGKGINSTIGYYDEPSLLTGDNKYFTLRKNKLYAIMCVDRMQTPNYKYDVVFINDEYFPWQFPIKNNSKYGLADTSGNLVVPAEYDSLISMNMARYEVEPCYQVVAKKDGKWGILNSSGKLLTPFIYAAIDNRKYHFTENNKVSPVVPVRIESKWGFIDTTGKTILPFEYDTVLSYHYNKKAIVVKEGKMGVVGFTGNVYFPFNYSAFETLNSNFINRSLFTNVVVSKDAPLNAVSAEVDGTWGLTDSTGKTLVDPNAKIIALYDRYTYTNPDYEGSDDSTFIGWLWNIGGEKIKAVAYADSAEVESMDEPGYYHNVAIVTYGYYFKGGKTGIVTRDGKFAIAAKYDDLVIPMCRTRNNEDYYPIYTSMSDHGKWLREEYQIDPKMPVIAKLSGKFGLIDMKGKEMLPFEFDSIQYVEVSNPYSFATDSVLKAGNYLKNSLCAYKGGKRAFYSISGKLLSPMSDPYVEMNPTYFCLYNDSCNGRTETNITNGIYLSIISKDHSIKKLDMLALATDFDFYTGEPIEAMVHKTYSFVVDGKINLLSPLNYKVMLKNWADDIIIIGPEGDTKRKTMQWSNLKSRRPNSDSIKNIDTAFDPNTDEIYTTIDDLCLNTIFLKYNGKWFLYSVNQSAMRNENAGFDSVQIGLKNFTAFLNGKFETYSYNYVGPFNPQNSLELQPFYSDADYSQTLAVRNCKLSYKNYSYEEYYIEIDQDGNDLHKTRIATKQIPFVVNGEFNIYNAAHHYLLKQWANDIVFPAATWNDRFSLTDSTSSVYDLEKIKNNQNMSISDGYTRSIALKYGSTWRLTSLAAQDKFIDGFDSVKFDEKNWIVTKKDKTFYYTIDGLQLVDNPEK